MEDKEEGKKSSGVRLSVALTFRIQSPDSRANTRFSGLLPTVIVILLVVMSQSDL